MIETENINAPVKDYLIHGKWMTFKWLFRLHRLSEIRMYIYP